MDTTVVSLHVVPEITAPHLGPSQKIPRGGVVGRILIKSMKLMWNLQRSGLGYGKQKPWLGGSMDILWSNAGLV